MNSELEALVAAAEQIAGGADPETVMAQLPAPTRIVFAAIALAAADRAVSMVNIAQVGQLSRGSAYNHHRDLIDRVRGALPALVARQLGGDSDAKGIAEVLADIQKRDETIARLRQDLTDAHSKQEAALSYARALHAQVKPTYTQAADERTKKVRHLRPVTQPAAPAEEAGDLT